MRAITTNYQVSASKFRSKYFRHDESTQSRTLAKQTSFIACTIGPRSGYLSKIIPININVKKPFVIGCFRLGALVVAYTSVQGQTNAPPHSSVYDGCGPSGTAKRAAELYLNPFKNRDLLPAKSSIKKINLKAMLIPGEDKFRYVNYMAAQITGYVASAKVGGIETCNCKSKDLSHRDTHIDVVLSPGDYANLKRHVIVEVTPRIRRLMASKGRAWSTPTLHSSLPGHRVRFTGWMFYDAEHRPQCFNTAPNNPKDWRATAWELHPVTNIEILQ